MITREVIDGRKATVAWLKNGEPASETEATQVKIVFDDGEIAFAVASDQQAGTRPQQ